MIGQVFTYLVYIAIPFIAFWVFYDRVPMFKRGVDNLMNRLSKKKNVAGIQETKLSLPVVSLEKTVKESTPLKTEKMPKEVYILKKIRVIEEDE